MGSITYIVLLSIGLVVSKEFRRGIFTLIGGLIVFTPIVAIGIVYNIGYPFYILVRYRSLKWFFYIYWRLINGTYSTIGNALYHGITLKWDEMGNVWGEWLEDIFTRKERTLFGYKNTTISASLGCLELNNIKTSKLAKGVSKLLNVVFRQRQHCIGAYLEKEAIEEVHKQDLYLAKKRGKHGG